MTTDDIGSDPELDAVDPSFSSSGAVPSLRHHSSRNMGEKAAVLWRLLLNDER
ncbi:hypothetical protein [Haloarcula nitratireducens]|uniref:Uncharacterized protein n=1 Tax=Haloarcula nitratireducens TaxID=2487749 RepID=A0AAW4P5R7_9EURY|nr:hypothetical protein [Halomicroarcula nitratireducens]MBX0293286.1 hypothetical protein [Halomicroarcula nitratireducens]